MAGTLHRLCAKCEQLSSGTLITAKPIVDPNDRSDYYFQTDARMESELGESEQHFRRCWPSQKILQQIGYEEPRATGLRVLVHKSLKELRQSADNKDCHLCYAIERKRCQTLASDETIKVSSKVYDRVFIILMFQYALSKAQPELHLCVCLLNEFSSPLLNVDRAYGQQTMWRLQCRPRPWNEQQERRGPFREEGLARRCINQICPDSLKRIHNWIRECMNQHDTNVQSAAPILPTRLIHIDQGSGGSLNLTLVDSTDLSPKGSRLAYATLSHCWGKTSSARVVLTRSNIKQWRKTIPFGVLPKTFQEAVRVAHQLGLAYLWIDALCILQDVKEDFDVEAPIMRSIYAESVVTLAATASEDGHGGLFVQDEHQVPTHVKFDCTGDRPLTSAYAVGDDIEAQYLMHIQDSPLNRRAWVFQERLLSPRIIHFTKGEIWWTCTHAVHKEMRENDDNLLTSIRTIPSATSQDSSWEDIVSDYTRKALTFPNDKLIAIAGVAEAFSRRRSGLVASDYIAGLWRANIKSQILWHRLGRSGPVVPIDNGSPTWSWSSQAEHVDFWHYRWEKQIQRQAKGALVFQESFDIVDVPLSQVGRDQIPFGPIRGGVIRIKALLLTVCKLDRHNKGSIINVEGRNGQEDIFLADWYPDPRDATQITPLTHVIPAAYYQRPKISHIEVALLGLRSVPGRRGCFTRVDMAIQRRAPKGEWWWKEGSQLYESEYLEDHGDGVYEIEVI